MTEIVPFNFDDQEIRVVMIGDEPWWIARDVCRVLDLENVARALSRLEEADITTSNVRSSDQMRPMKMVNEFGLYDLILDSRKPAAKKFRRWITSEVLPQIRKTGSYSASPALPKSFAEALELAARQARAIEDQQVQINELEPQARQFKKWQFSEDTVYVGAWAKVIGLTEREAFDALRDVGVLRRRGMMKRMVNTPNRAYEQYFELIVRRISGRKPWDVTPMIKPEGQVILAELLEENGWIK